MSSMSDGLEEWFLRTLDQAGRANVLCIQNREAAAMLLEMHKVLSSAEARGSGRVMFSFKGVAQYRDTNAYGQWSSIAGRSPAQCTLVLTTASASPEPLLSPRCGGLDPGGIHLAIHAASILRHTSNRLHHILAGRLPLPFIGLMHAAMPPQRMPSKLHTQFLG